MVHRSGFGALQPVADDAAYGRMCPLSGHSSCLPKVSREVESTHSSFASGRSVIVTSTCIKDNLVRFRRMNRRGGRLP